MDMILWIPSKDVVTSNMDVYNHEDNVEDK